MSDDDLIRDAVHELVAAAPVTEAAPDGRRVVGRLVPLAGRRRRGDPRHRRDRRHRLDASPTTTRRRVATTAPPPLPTPPPATVVTSTPAPTSPVDRPRAAIDGPSDRREHVARRRRRAPTTTTTTTTRHRRRRNRRSCRTTSRPSPMAATTTPPCCSTRAAWSSSGAPTCARCSPSTANLDDLPARLQSWCENVAICTQPDTALVDIGGYWLATWTTPGGAVTGYFRSGSFEGSPSVGGLPPRRPSGAVGAVPDERRRSRCARPTSTATARRDDRGRPR